MKVVLTIADSEDAALGGGEISRFSYIFEIPDDDVPDFAKKAILEMQNPSRREPPFCYKSASLSIVAVKS